MTWPEIEPQSPRSLVNTQTIMLMCQSLLCFKNTKVGQYFGIASLQYVYHVTKAVQVVEQ